jgi:hypothetical protein
MSQPVLGLTSLSLSVVTQSLTHCVSLLLSNGQFVFYTVIHEPLHTTTDKMDGPVHLSYRVVFPLTEYVYFLLLPTNIVSSAV